MSDVSPEAELGPPGRQALRLFMRNRAAVFGVVLLTVGAAAPSILLLTTSFTRFVIVLGLTRNALGTQQIPPNQVLSGIALFLTLFVMAPVLSQINEDALQPMLSDERNEPLP